MPETKDIHGPKQKRGHWSALMAAAQAGDKAAYARLLTDIAPALRSFLMKRVIQKDGVEDILQDILLAIHAKRHTFLPDQPFENWMYGIARHKMVDFFRKNGRKTAHEFIPEDQAVTFGDNSTNDLNKTLSRDLETALGRLSDTQRKIVVLTKIEGYSMAETAVKMGMTETAVKVAAHRAYKKLKTDLADYEYG